MLLILTIIPKFLTTLLFLRLHCYWQNSRRTYFLLLWSAIFAHNRNFAFVIVIFVACAVESDVFFVQWRFAYLLKIFFEAFIISAFFKQHAVRYLLV